MGKALRQLELMASLGWKRKVGMLAGMLPVARPRQVILLYHTLGSRPPAVTLARFRQQLDWLSANARLVTLDALLTSTVGAALEVAITFDDGYASLHDEVAPLLQTVGASATVYLNSGLVGEQSRKASDAALGHYPDAEFLTWPEVQTLVAAGWNIGSHGVEHIDLTAVTAPVAVQQLAASKQQIADRLAKPCQDFAYTWGRFTPGLQQQVRAAGYRSAASGLHGPVRADSDRFALPRIDIRADYELRDFIAAVSGQWDFLGHKQRLWRAFA